MNAVRKRIEPHFGADRREPAPGSAAISRPLMAERRIGGHNWAFGLVWLSSHSPDSSHMPSRDEIVREARRRASDPDVAADVYAARTGVASQAGIGWRGRTGRLSRRLFSAAILLADSVGEARSWLGCWPLPAESGGDDAVWWCVEVREDFLLPDGDAVLTEAEARARIGSVAAAWRDGDSAGFRLLFIPEDWAAEWGLAGMDLSPRAVRHDDLDGLLARRKPEKAMRLIQAPVAASMRGAGSRRHRSLAVLGVAGIAAASAYIGFKPHPRPVIAPPPPPPVLGVMPSAWIGACVGALDTIYVALPGWHLGGLTCQSPTDGAKGSVLATATYKRTWGSVAVVAKRFGTAAAPSDDGDTVTVSAAPGRAPETRRATDLVSADVVKTRLLALSQETGVPVRMSGTNGGALPGAVLGQSGRGQASVPFLISSPLPPPAWASILNAIPGTVVTRVALHLAKQTWDIKGVAYVR